MIQRLESDTNKYMRKFWMIVMIGVVIALVGVSAYVYGQNKGLEKNTAAKTENNASNSINLTSTPVFEKVEPSQGLVKQAVLVIEAEGAYPAGDAEELRERVANPYLDYNTETRPGEVVSLTISQNLQASKASYPYQANAVFSNGGYEGFLISKSNGHIDFWHPECMGECVFSDSFKAKYPEITQ